MRPVETTRPVSSSFVPDRCTARLLASQASVIIKCIDVPSQARVTGPTHESPKPRCFSATGGPSITDARQPRRTRARFTGTAPDRSTPYSRQPSASHRGRSDRGRCMVSAGQQHDRCRQTEATATVPRFHTQQPRLDCHLHPGQGPSPGNSLILVSWRNGPHGPPPSIVDDRPGKEP
jgi:hypothetical protein